MFGYDWPRLHAALNDLPTALLLMAALFELLALATRRESFRVVSFWTLVVGAVGAVAAVLSGLQAEESIAHGDAVHRVMETHELLAFVTLGIFGVLTVWRVWRERRMGTAERAVGLAMMLGGAGVLIATAAYGGRLVFDHAAGISTEVLTSEIQNREAGHSHGAGEGHGDEPHDHGPAAAPMTADSAGAGEVPSAGDHADPAVAPPHSHPAGTPAHEH